MLQRKTATVRLLILATLLLPQLLTAQSAGLIEYFVPGPEEQLRAVFEDMDNDPVIGDHMDAIITVAAAADSTTLYYDHWENGYNFDPDNPSSADEVWMLNSGQHHTFSDTGIFANPRNSSETYYDGGDRIYTVGGAVTLTRISWPSNVPTYYALSWEVYPNMLLNQDYIIPIGENLDDGPLGYTDFENTYLLLQATRDNTQVTVNDPFFGGVELDTTMALGDYSQLYHINSGTEIHASKPVQVQFVVGRTWSGPTSECRGFSAVPTAAWGESYYCPVVSWESGFHSDLYLYNPNDFTIDVDWENKEDQGVLTLAANETRSFYEVTGDFLPTNSGTYVSSDDVFWGIGSGGTRNGSYDWGCGLVPEEYLTPNYKLGWAPSTWSMMYDGSPVFVTATRDSTTVWVDWSPADGEADASWEIDRLDLLKINDPDHDNSGIHIWATEPLAATWGEDADMADPGNDYLDVGYAALPIPDSWMELVLRVESAAAPASLPGNGGSTQLQIEVSSFDWAIEDPRLVTTLPDGWDYVPGSSHITLPNGSEINGSSADPMINGDELTWLHPVYFAPNEMMRVECTVQTNGDHEEGQNEFAVKAEGRWDNSQVFNAQSSSWVFIASADSRIKPLYLREDSGYTLQRVPPTGEHLDLWIPEAGSASWTISPVLADSLHISGDINILLYLYRNTPFYSPDVEIELNWNDGFTHLIGTDAIEDIGSGFYTFFLPAVDLTIPPGATVELVLRVTETGPGDRSISLRYDGAEYPSRVVLATDTYLAISSFAAYDAPWPEGEMTSVFYADDPIWLTTVATDPFGYADITSSSVGIPPVLSHLPLAIVDEGGNQRIFSGSTSIAQPGTYTAVDTTREGFEGTVEQIRDFTLIIIKTGLHSLLSYTDHNGDELIPGDTVTVEGLLYNGGTADATGVRNELALPDHFTYLNGSSSQGLLELNGNLLSLEAGTIAAGGDSISWSFQALLDDIVDNNTLFQLQSQLTDNEGDLVLSDDPLPNQWSDDEEGNDPSDPADDDPLGLLISSSSIITATCTVTDLNGSPAVPADSLLYHLQLTNSGDQHLDDIDEILFALPRPQHTSFQGSSLYSDSGLLWLAGDTLYWQGQIAVDQLIDISCIVNIDLPLYNGTEIAAQARVQYDAESSGELSELTLSDDPATPEPADPTLITVSSAPLMMAPFTVTDLNALAAEPGDTLSWELVIQNDGNSNSADNDGPEAMIPCPEWNTPLSWHSSQGSLQLSGDTLWYNGTLPVTEDVVITLLTQLAHSIPDQTVIQSQATVLYDSTSTGSNSWLQLSDNPATPEVDDPTSIQVSSDLMLTALLTVQEAELLTQRGTDKGTGSGESSLQQQRDEPETYYPGTVQQWEFLVSNSGGNPSTNLDWTLDLPQELVNLSNLVFPPEAENLTDSTGGSWGNGLLHFIFDDLEYGDTLLFAFQVMVDSAAAHDTLVSCQAEFNCDQLPEPMLSDSDPDSVGAQPTQFLVQRALLQGEGQLSALDLDGYPLTPGDTLELTLNWINHSGLTLSDVSFTEAIHPELPWFEVLELPAGAVDNSTDSGGEWGYGQLQIDGLQAAPGDTLTCSWQLVPALVPDSTVVALQGELFSGSDSLLTDADPDSVGTQPLLLVISNRPDLLAELTVSVEDRLNSSKQDIGNWFSSKKAPQVLEETAEPGDRLLWECSLQSTGTDLAAELEISVSLPAWLENITIEEWSDALNVIHQPDGGAYDNGMLIATGDGLANGDSLSFSFATVIQMNVPDSTLLSTSGQITSAALPDTVWTDGDPDTNGDQPTEVLVLSQDGDLSGTLLVADLNGGYIRSGDTLRFVSHWTNSYLYDRTELVFHHEMPPFTRMIAAEYLPAGAQDSVSWSGGAHDRGLIEVTDLTLSGSGTDSLQYLVLVDSVLTASVADTTQGWLQTDAMQYFTDGDTLTPGIQPTRFKLTGDSDPGDMQLTLTRTGSDPLWAGASADFELSLTNLSDELLESCSIILPLPDWVAETTVTAQPGGTLVAGNPISCYGFDLEPDETGTMAVTLVLNDDLNVNDIVELQGWCSSLLIPGPINSNLWSDTLQTAPPVLTLDLAGFINEVELDPGATIMAQDSLEYDFILTNSGGITLTDISISGTLDAALQYRSAGMESGTVDFSGGVLTFSGISLTPGDSVSGFLRADIIDPLPRYTVISSQLTAACGLLTVMSDSDPAQPGEQPLEYTVDFLMNSPLLIWDNPVRERAVSLVYNAPGAGSVDLAIYNVLGEQVRSFSNLPSGDGMTLLWHTDNNSGQALVNGTYILVLNIDGELTREKIALIR